jgi:sulfatase maturation enzyme AslB (radical SAM superfamily)
MGEVTTSGFAPVRTTDLPVFRMDHGAYAAFYAPGFLAVVKGRGADGFESALGDARAPDRDPVLAALIRHAEHALAVRAAAVTADFQPVCLTLYLGNQCNLHCTYCYASSSPERAAPLGRSAIRAAAQQVLANCERRSAPLTIVFHGGGEPTLYPDLIDHVLDELEPKAAERDVPVFRYLATNGVLPASRARKLARRFDIIGISCDGPACWQSVQRPTWGGRASTPAVERTAEIVRDAGTSVHVRVTVTARTLHHQAQIARYVCERLKPDEINVEPLYAGGRAGPSASLGADQAVAFVDGLMEAHQVAATFGVPLRTSGSRIGELHGPYCNVFRDVLQVVPGGVATTCFKTSTDRESDMRGMTMGRAHGDVLTLEPRRITALRRILGAWPESCGNCFNRFHCSIGCPDSCPLEPQAEPSVFRCRVQMTLAQRMLDELAAALWQNRGSVQDVIGQEVGSSCPWD